MVAAGWLTLIDSRLLVDFSSFETEIKMSVVTLTVDDKLVGAREGQTLLEVIQEQGIEIPTLCHLDGLKEVGGCRLCLVEVKGSPRLLASCTTQVLEGMIVQTHSQRNDSPSCGHHLDPLALMIYACHLFGKRLPAWKVSVPGVDFGHGDELSEISRQAIVEVQDSVVAKMLDFPARLTGSERTVPEF
jgi:ferredoxin